jgi:hypothetical protein
MEKTTRYIEKIFQTREIYWRPCMLTFLFFLLSCLPQDGFITADNQIEPYAYQAKTNLGVLSIQIVSPIIYLPKNGSASIWDFCKPSTLVKDGEPVEVRAGYYNLKPKPLRLVIDKSDDY